MYFLLKADCLEHAQFPAVVDPIFTAIEAIAEQFMQMFTGENGASNSDAARVVQAKLEVTAVSPRA